MENIKKSFDPAQGEKEQTKIINLANPAPLGLLAFGMTAFISYGFFWLSLVAIIVMPEIGWAERTSSVAMAAYLFVWGLFTAVMFVGTLKLSKSLQFIFGSLTLLFFLLAVGDLTGNGTIKIIAGYEGIICGFSAIYTASAQILNGVYKKTVLPV